MTPDEKREAQRRYNFAQYDRRRDRGYRAACAAFKHDSCKLVRKLLGRDGFRLNCTCACHG